MKAYQFGKAKGKKIQVTAKKEVPTVNPNPVVIHPIQGQQPGSKEEFYVAMALEKLELKFNYQYEIFDGRQIAGGQIIDFLVYTAPMPTPVYVQGEYWHRDRSKEEYKLARAKMYFKGNAMPPVELWGKDLQTPEMAYQTVKRELKQ